jgi:hypothetical protein
MMSVEVRFAPQKVGGGLNLSLSWRVIKVGLSKY